MLQIWSYDDTASSILSHRDIVSCIPLSSRYCAPIVAGNCSVEKVWLSLYCGSFWFGFLVLFKHYFELW